jgi:hypothetical protein
MPIRGRVGAAIIIVADAHVPPESAKALFREEQHALLGRDRRRGGRDIDVRSLELVRFVEASAGHGLPDFRELRTTWNHRWKNSHKAWIYKYASWMRRDYERTAKSLFGRALAAGHMPTKQAKTRSAV